MSTFVTLMYGIDFRPFPQGGFVQVNVADYVYRIVNIDGKIFYNRRECLVFLDHDSCEIKISGAVPKDQRETLIAKAVADAWRYRTYSWRPAYPVLTLSA